LEAWWPSAHLNAIKPRGKLIFFEDKWILSNSQTPNKHVNLVAGKTGKFGAVPKLTRLGWHPSPPSWQSRSRIPILALTQILETTMLRIFPLLLFCSALTLEQPPGGGDVTKPVQLLPAKDLSGWTIHVKGEDQSGPSKVFSLQDGMVKVSGLKGGYLATKHSYSNYRLVAEYKWDPESPSHDSGIFVHAVIPEKGPVRALEVNLLHGVKTAFTGEIWLLDGPQAKLTINGTVKSKGGIPTMDRKDHEKPLGEWNTIDILCDGGKVQTKVNGNVTLEGTDAEPRAGKICLQSNRGIIYFKRLELLPVAK
jgi:hypothetical protein